MTIYKRDVDGKTMGENEKINLKGSINDIFKTAINGMLPNRIDVFAAAGKGKTTTAAKMTHDWAHDMDANTHPSVVCSKAEKCLSRSLSGAGNTIRIAIWRGESFSASPREIPYRTNQNLWWVMDLMNTKGVSVLKAMKREIVFLA